MKFPTMEEFAKNVAEKALDEYEYKGKTLRQWIEIISVSEHSTNLASLGTDCISRQQAIDAIVDELDKIDHVPQWVFDRLTKRLKSLSPTEHELPPAQPEKRTETHACDSISRQAAIEAVDESRRLNHHQDGKEACAHEYEHRHFLKILRDLPSAEPKKGKWIIKDDTERFIAQCNCCRYIEDSRRIKNFCPNCGADMRTAEQIVHDAIDNTTMAEDAYPGIKERLHRAVDDMRKVTT